MNDLPSAPETATLAVDPSGLDFGILEPGETATAHFAITNEGPADATLDGLDLVNSTAFTMTNAPSGPLLAGQTVDVTVAYTATTTAGPRCGDRAERRDELRRCSVDMTGAARLAKLVVEPGLLEFQSTAGEPVVESAFVRNDGYAPLTVGIHYIDEPSFAAVTATPYDLSPGESIEVPITWTPDEVGTAEGRLWVSSNVGDASSRAARRLDDLLRRRRGLGSRMARAPDRPAGGEPHAHELRRERRVHDALDAVLLGRVAGRGARRVDARRRRRADRRSPAGESVTFQYDAESDPAWMCIEETQVTQGTTDFWFFGAYVPEPLRTKLALDSQDVIWDEIATNPVVLVGRVQSTFELAVGESEEITVEVMNLGRVATDAQVVERVPEWLRVVAAGDATATVEPDGTTTLEWDTISLAGAFDTDDLDDATIYDPHYLSYEVTLDACPESRNVGMGPSALWVDAGLTLRTSDGSPLVVHCDP